MVYRLLCLTLPLSLGLGGCFKDVPTSEDDDDTANVDDDDGATSDEDADTRGDDGSDADEGDDLDDETGSSGEVDDSGDTQEGGATDSGSTGDSGDSGSTGDVGDSGSTGDSGDTGDPDGDSDSGGDLGDVGDGGMQDLGVPDVPPGNPCDTFSGEVVFINFEGVTLTEGLVDNAPSNITSESVLAGSWDPYSPASDDQDSVMTFVQSHWDAYDICITDERPSALDYSMLVVSGTVYNDNPNIPSIGNPTDCDNATHNQVGIVFLSDEAGLSVPTKAIAISKTTARFFGLESVSATSDIMHQFIGLTLNGATFTDMCHELAAGTVCGGTDACVADHQNSHAHLTTILGSAI